MKRVHIFIYGDVIGVGFRFWTRGQALKLGVTGWVRNCADDCVEAVFEGEEKDVKSIVGKCHKGPEVAWVEKVDVKDEEYKGQYRSFEVVK